MIISRIQYGLGNQLFQYALGKRLSIERGEKLKLDLTWFRDHKIDPKIKVRNYQLKYFNIQEEIASDSEIRKFRYFDYSFATRLKSRVRQMFGTYPGKGYILEEGRHDDTAEYNEEQLKNNHKDIFLEGCWQSENYFTSIEEPLRSVLTFNFEFDGQNQAYFEQIRSTTSVSLHVRRGDYLDKQFYHKFGTVCTLEYYKKAIEVIKESVKNPTFFVFSDEPDWVQRNLKFDGDAVFVNCNDQGKAYMDMKLMSSCNHNIIANSTFSWWAAWLNNKKDKMVVAPKIWKQGQYENLALNEWIQI